MIVRRPVVLIVQSAEPQDRTEAGANEGYLTLRAAEAESGYEMARAKLPDVVAIDITIAGGTGWALCRLLKRDPLTASIPVVVLAAAGTPETTAHARYVGALAVLTEPTTAGALLAVVRDTLAESSAA